MAACATGVRKLKKMRRIDMDSDRFWVDIWKLIIPGVLILVVLILSYQGYKKSIMLDMIKAGASPIEAMLATHTVSNYEQVFYLEALEQSK